MSCVGYGRVSNPPLRFCCGDERGLFGVRPFDGPLRRAQDTVRVSGLGEWASADAGLGWMARYEVVSGRCGPFENGPCYWLCGCGAYVMCGRREGLKPSSTIAWRTCERGLFGIRPFDRPLRQAQDTVRVNGMGKWASADAGLGWMARCEDGCSRGTICGDGAYYLMKPYPGTVSRSER